MSLKLPNRTLDFVIKDSKQIIKFLQAVTSIAERRVAEHWSLIKSKIEY